MRASTNKESQSCLNGTSRCPPWSERPAPTGICLSTGPTADPALRQVRRVPVLGHPMPVGASAPTAGQIPSGPNPIPAKAGIQRPNWVQASGKGTVWTYTVTYQNRTTGFDQLLPFPFRNSALTSSPSWNLRRACGCSQTSWAATPARSPSACPWR